MKWAIGVLLLGIIAPMGSLTRDVAYGRLLFEQRQQLHRAVAERIERVHADDLSAHFPLLANHFLKNACKRFAKPDRYISKGTMMTLQTYQSSCSII